MATSQHSDPPRRHRPGDRARRPGEPAPAGGDAAPVNPHEHSPGQPDARGTSPVANTAPTPASTGVAGAEPRHDHDGRGGAKRATERSGATRASEVDDPDIDAALDAMVDEAPPLPYEVRARLARLLRGDGDRGQSDHTGRSERAA
jgi:hypothetical protein